MHMHLRCVLYIVLAGLIAILHSGCNADKLVPQNPSGAVSTAEIEQLEAPSGIDPELFAELKAVLINALKERQAVKTICTPPQGANSAVNDLTTTDIGGGSVRLQWTHLSQGDYDANGEVNSGDLVPIAQYFHAVTTDANWAVASSADGDLNGEVNAGDIVPIAANWQASVRYYGVYSSADIADYPAGPDDPNGAGATQRTLVSFTNAGTNNARSTFSVDLLGHQSGVAYWVRAIDWDNNLGARSNRSEVGVTPGELGLAVHIASANQPISGTGTAGDPYYISWSTPYQLQLVHNVDGDVTSHAATSYAVSTAEVSTSSTGYMLAGGLARSFTVTGSYNGSSTTAYFEATGTAASLAFGVNPATSPSDGAGTQANPYQINISSNYSLQVIDELVPQEVTGSCFFNTSHLDIQVDPTGDLIIDPGFAGAFSVTAIYNAVATTPAELYFNCNSGNIDPVAEYSAVSGFSGAYPFDAQFDASASYDPDGTITSYQWDIDDDGIFDYSSANPVMEYSYRNLFQFSPTLRVIDDQGASTDYKATENINVTGSPTWHIGTASPRGLNGCKIADMDGVPNIVITGDNYVDFLRGSDAVGTAFSKYESLDAQPTYQGHMACDLGSYLGLEYFVYIPSDNNFTPAIVNMRFLGCNNASGSDWPAIGGTVEFNGYPGDVAVQTVDGGINVYFIDSNQQLMMYRSDNGGSTWNAANLTIESSFSIAADFDVSFLDYPMAAFAAASDHRLYFRKADNASGTSWPGLSHTIDDFNPAYSICLDTANGVPCVAYVDASDAANNNTPIYFCYARDAEGSSWVAPIEVANAHWSSVRNISMTKIKTKPAITYWDESTGNIMYVRANDWQGSWWGEPVHFYTWDIRNISMCEIDFKPAIAFNTTADGGVTSSGTMFAMESTL